MGDDQRAVRSLGRIQEDQARSKPRFYSLKVMLLALLGNAQVAAMLPLIVALLVALFASASLLRRGPGSCDLLLVDEAKQKSMSGQSWEPAQ